MRFLNSVSLVALMLLVPSPVNAQWVLKPFAGMTMASSHGFVDLEQTMGKSKPVVGLAFGWQPRDVGVEVELATVPSFLKDTGELLNRGRLVTMMANVTWLPLAGWRDGRVRPYVSGGAGAVRVSIDDVLGAFSSESTLAAGNVAAGITLRLQPRFAINAEARYFRSRFGEQNVAGFGDEYVAFTRVIAGAVVRF